MEPPSWIVDFSNRIGLSHHQSGHLSRMLTGLIASKNKTIDGISRISPGSPDQKAANKFFNDYDWDATEANRERIRELQRHNETRWKKRGIGIIDDTIIKKSGKHIEGTGKFFDHGKGRFVWGHNIVSLHFADHKTSYALDYRHYVKKGEPGFKTKIEIAKDLITEGIENMQLPAFTFIGDAWYLCRDLVDHIESYKRLWVFSSKTDRLVLVNRRYVNISEYYESLGDGDFMETEIDGEKMLVHHRTFRFRSLGKKARLIISRKGKDVLFLVTNRSGTFRGIISDYMLRWSIETFYKDAKQQLGLDKCQMRKLEGIKKYWYLVLMAHSVLRLGVGDGIFSKIVSTKSVVGKVKGACLDMLGRFLIWVMESGRDVTEVIDMVGSRLL